MPLIIIIIVSALVVIGLIIGGIFFFLSRSLSNAADEDFFEIGNDKVPSVKYILGERRDVISVSSSVSGDTSRKIIQYSVSSNQREDMETYALALMSEHGFYNTTPYDFTGSTGRGFDFTKESRESGFIVIVTIDYDRSGYTISILRAKGTLTIPDSEPDPGPAIEVEPPVSPPIAPPENTDDPTPPPDNDPIPPGLISNHPLVGIWDWVSGVEIWFFAEAEFIIFIEEVDGSFLVFESDYEEWGSWEINSSGQLVVVGEQSGERILSFILDGDLLTLIDEDGDEATYRRRDLW